MTTLEKIQWLADKTEGLGIPFTVLAKHCHCSTSTIGSIVREEKPMTEKMTYLIESGIEDILNIMKMKFNM